MIDSVFLLLPPTETAVVFFFAFGRFEFALKQCGFLRARKGTVSADWDRFTDEVPDVTIGADDDEMHAIAFLLREPPQRQAVIDGELSFSALQLEGPVNRRLGLIVRTIRNNLFHGGKIPYGIRDEELVGAALVVLERFLRLHDDVARAFRGLL